MTLKEMRKRRKLTQDEVAKYTDTTKTYIFLLEKGKRNPSDIMKIKLAKLYNVKPVDIFLATQQTKCYIKNI